MKFLIIILTLCSINIWADMDINKIAESLKTTGLKGEIHGSSVDSKLFVITFRNPENFFENIQLPLVSENPVIQDLFKTIKRHQYYTIKGEFLDNKAPIKHINVTSIELAKDYSSELDHMPYEYKGNLSDLNSMKSLVGRVHAVAENGKFLVMEYKDRVVPVLVRETASQEMAQKLYRGDKVKIRFAVRSEPEAPTHLNLELQSKLNASEFPIEVIDSLVSHHGEEVTKTGTLVKFPKSPQINFNIYALLVEDETGSTIQFTLTNLTDMDLFQKLRNKMEKVWDDNATSIENDRNKLINRKIQVTAKGKYNMIDRGQANPQIIISSVDDLSFELK